MGVATRTALQSRCCPHNPGRATVPSGFRDILSKLAARLGLEPRQNESESFVLPLHHQAVKLSDESGAGDGIRTRNRLFTKQVLYR